MNVEKGQLDYAGFWIRLLASFIDGIVLVVPLFALNFALMLGVFGISMMTDIGVFGLFPLVLTIFNSFVSIAYFVGMTCSKYQGTVGKMVLGLKVVGEEGERISFGKSVGRYFGQVLSGLIFNIGYLMVGITPEKRGLHDYIAKTYVMKK